MTGTHDDDHERDDAQPTPPAGDVNRHRHPYPAFDYRARIAGLADRVDADAAVLAHPLDVVYYAGTGQPANLCVPADSPEDARLFVRRAMRFAEDEVGLPPGQLRRGGLSAVADHLGEVDTFATELDVLPASLVGKLESVLGAEAVDVSPDVLAQRAVKSDAEVELLREAASTYGAAHERIMARAAPGVTEKAVAGAAADGIVSAGVDDNVFFRRWDARLPAAGLIASGENLPMVSGHAMTVTGVGASRSLPWGPSRRELRRGDLVVADLGLNHASYHGDVARTYVVGAASDPQRERFELVREIQAAAVEALGPGEPAENAYLAARERAESAGVADYLCGYGEMQAPYVGHAIGIEIDEPPTLMAGVEAPLEPGMVVTVEPKLIDPERGAVMVEDDYLITGDGVERLSVADRELFEVPHE